MAKSVGWLGTVWRATLIGAVTCLLLQCQEKGKAAFEGKVVDSVTGQGVAKAEIQLQAMPERTDYLGHSGPDGKFRFEAIEAGEYFVHVKGRGYAGSSVVKLQASRSTSRLHFAEGQNVTGAIIDLDPEAVVSGRVTDADGEALADSGVVAVQERWLNGNRLFFGATDVHTDDRGQFRLVLPPGHYYLTAGVREPDGAAVLREAPDKPEMRIAAQYYPAASSIDSASPVELRPGQQLTGMDFRLPAVPTYHVRGVVAVPGMQPPDRLSLRNRNGDMVRGSAYSAVLKGSFDIAGVSPGSYWVEFGSDHPVTMRKTRIDVTDHDVDGIQLAPMAPFGVKLRVRFEEDSLPHPYAQLMLSSLEPLAIGFHTFSSDVGEVFQGPFGCGEYVLKLTPDSDVYVKSVTYAGRPIAGNKIDMSNGPAGLIEAVLATGTGAVTGTVADSQALWALLVSADDDTGNSGVRLAELDATGQFKISFVPPGKWLVFSIQNLDVPHWENRAYVQEMAGRGTPVVVEKGVTAHVEIKP